MYYGKIDNTMSSLMQLGCAEMYARGGLTHQNGGECMLTAHIYGVCFSHRMLLGWARCDAEAVHGQVHG